MENDEIMETHDWINSTNLHLQWM